LLTERAAPHFPLGLLRTALLYFFRVLLLPRLILTGGSFLLSPATTKEPTSPSPAPDPVDHKLSLAASPEAHDRKATKADGAPVPTYL
jgi:hypothetical protein